MRENDYPDEPPMDPEHVRDCLTYFSEEKRQSKNTIQAMVNAIRSFHASAGLESPTELQIVRDRKKKLARDKRDEKEEQAPPLLPAYLRAIIETAFLRRPYGRGFETEKTARTRGLEDIALLWICFDALLRISEALAFEWRDIQQLPDGHNRPDNKALQDRPGGPGGAPVHISRRDGGAERASPGGRQIDRQGVPHVIHG